VLEEMKRKSEEAKREIFRQKQLKEKIDRQLEDIKRKQERQEQLREEVTSIARQFLFQMEMDSPQRQLIEKLVFEFRELHAEVEAELQELKEKMEAITKELQANI
jgi:vacuolar-type H+-ATPase subunit I/STV1